MDKIEDRKAKANLKRYLGDFPWLWAILQKWHRWSVTVSVEFIDYSWNAALQHWLPGIGYQLWVKGTNTIMGNDEPVDEIRDCTPEKVGDTLNVIIANSKEMGFFHPQFAILVYERDEKKHIKIFRPPAHQEFL